MSYIGGNMKSLAGMSKGAVDFNQDYVSSTGKAIAAMATAFPELFPEGSDAGANTEAGPAIFTEGDKFAAIAADLKAGGDAVAKVQNADELGAAFGMVASTCKACHSDYRVKK
jgi:cytochrome c556